MHPTSLAVTPAAFAPVAPALTLAGDTRSVSLPAMAEEEHVVSEDSAYLRQAILEIVENQLRDNDPRETGETLCRLMREGHSEADAKRLIGAVVAAEVYAILKFREQFNHGRFVAALRKLPDLPSDEHS